MNTVGRVQIVNGTRFTCRSGSPITYIPVIDLTRQSFLSTTIYTFKILIFALEGIQQIVGYAITRMNFLCNVKKRNTKRYLPQFEQVLQWTGVHLIWICLGLSLRGVPTGMGLYLFNSDQCYLKLHQLDSLRSTHSRQCPLFLWLHIGRVQKFVESPVGWLQRLLKKRHKVLLSVRISRDLAKQIEMFELTKCDLEHNTNILNLFK